MSITGSDAVILHPVKYAAALAVLVSLPSLATVSIEQKTTTLPHPSAAATSVKPITEPLKTDTLPETIQAKLIDANLPPDSVSIMVQPLHTNAPTNSETPVVSYHADTPRTPASTQKLIPTFIALDTLGKDFVWQTKLYQHGMVWQGTLYGDVILQGSGDPKLDSDNVYHLLNQIKSQGIKQVNGNLIIDNRQFEGVKFDVNAFDAKGLRPYNAQPNALLSDFGTLNVVLDPIVKATKPAVPKPSADDSATLPNPMPELESDSASAPPAINPSDIQGYQVTVKPTLAGFQAPTQLATSTTPCNNSKDDWIANVTPTALSFIELPSVHCGRQERWLTFPDGDVMVKNMITADWQRVLPKFGGQIVFAKQAGDWQQQTKPIPEVLPWYLRWYLNYKGEPIKPKLIAYVASNPLSEQIKDINQHSNNVMTEQIALSMPLYVQKQTVSNYPKTFALMKSWWQKHLPDTTPPVMSRASGLCRDCLVKPNSLLALLNYAYHSPNAATFRDSLGVAGESGTIKALKLRQPNNPAIGRAWIKTGTLDNVTSMAGYVQGQSGQWYAVVGMINQDNVTHNAKAKAVLDEMLAWTAVH